MRNFRGREQHRRRVRARRRASTAANARRCFHRSIGILFRNQSRVRFRRRTRPRRDEPARLDDSIERAAIHDQILEERKRFCAERLDHDRRAILESAHVNFARRPRMIGTVRFPVNRERASSADSFATIRIERDRLLAFRDESFVDDVQHFEERRVRRNVRRLIFDKFAFRLRIFLAPDFEAKVHL